MRSCLLEGRQERREGLSFSQTTIQSSRAVHNSEVIAMTEKHQNCACERCVAARRSMLLRTHPIHARRDEDIPPSLIPVDQALAMALEERDDLRMRLAQVDSDIKVLRDCSQWGIT